MNKTKPLKIFMVHWKNEPCIITLLQWKHTLGKRFSTLAIESCQEYFKYSDIWLHPDNWIKIFVSGAQISILKNFFLGNYYMESDWKFCLKFKFKIHQILSTVWLSLSSSENWAYNKDFNIGNLLGSDSRKLRQRIGEVRWARREANIGALANRLRPS